MNPDPITEPYREGMRAFDMGLPVSANPYPMFVASDSPYKSYDPKYLDWGEGWFYQANLNDPT